jgi:hypothetical protein
VLAAVRFGIYGLLYLQVISSVVVYIINGHTSGKVIGYAVLLQLRDLLPIFSIALLAAVPAWYLDKHSVFGSFDLVRIILLCLFYLFIYIGLFVAFRAREIRDFYEIFLQKFTEKYILKGA